MVRAQRIFLCVLSHSVVSNSCVPIDCSPPVSSVHGILQAKILEWVAISFSRILSVLKQADEQFLAHSHTCL